MKKYLFIAFFFLTAGSLYSGGFVSPTYCQVYDDDNKIWNETYPITNLIDENISTYFKTGSFSSSTKFWLDCDLGSIRKISKVKVTLNPHIPTSAFPTNFYFAVSRYDFWTAYQNLTASNLSRNINVYDMDISETESRYVSFTFQPPTDASYRMYEILFYDENYSGGSDSGASELNETLLFFKDTIFWQNEYGMFLWGFLVVLFFIWGLKTSL
jgi:hypothetical protein